MRILDREKINYKVHIYDTTDGQLDGLSVAKKTEENPEQVFKTLVTVGDNRNHYVFVIPVAEKLDLKACARAVGVRSVEMIPQKELLPLTGYVHGGCSPVGMKKLFTTVFDQRIENLETVLVSGGRIGTQVEVAPADLLNITGGFTAVLTRDEIKN